MCAVKHSWTEIYEARHRERRVARGLGIAGVRGGGEGELYDGGVLSVNQVRGEREEKVGGKRRGKGY